MGGFMFGARFCTKTACTAHVCAHIQHPPQPGPHPTPFHLHFHLHCASSNCFRLHTIDLLNTPVCRPSLSLPATIHPNPVVIEFGSESIWQWPSLSSESKNSSHRIRVRVGGSVYFLSKFSRHQIRFASPLAAHDPSESSRRRIRV